MKRLMCLRALLAAFIVLLSGGCTQAKRSAESLKGGITLRLVDDAASYAVKLKAGCGQCIDPAPLHALAKTNPNLIIHKQGPTWVPLVVEEPMLLDITAAELKKDEWGPALALQMTPSAKERFHALTTRNVTRRLAIMLGGKVIAAPIIKEAIPSGRLQIDWPDQSFEDTRRLLEAERKAYPKR